ncbi:MAG: hypothetical protein LW884_09780 [Bacteroidetes bacterium]|nr:hypothetical protein [Bacteroidota bacterium]
MVPAWAQAQGVAQVAMPDQNLQPQDPVWMKDEQPIPYSGRELLEYLEPRMYYSLDTLFYKDVEVFGFDVYRLEEKLPNLVRRSGPYAGKCVDQYSLLVVSVQALKELAAQQQNLQRQIQAYNQEFMAIRKDMEDLKTLVSQQQGQARKLEATLNKVGELEKRVAELEAARASK